MDSRSMDLFELAERRLAWTSRRQTLLAQNIANISTPGFVPKDVPDFARALSGASIAPRRTQPNHLAGAPPGSLLSDQPARPAVQSADGNAVGLDEQLAKVADTATAQAAATAIYRKYLTFFGLALGRAS
jgi:flagellar basal-body rod protein FlgB